MDRVPVSVERVDFEGLSRTSKEFMRDEYSRHGVFTATNMDQLVLACKRAQQAQLNLGVFKHTNIQLTPGTNIQDVRVQVQTQEKNWYGVHIGVEHDGADAYTVSQYSTRANH